MLQQIKFSQKLRMWCHWNQEGKYFLGEREQCSKENKNLHIFSHFGCKKITCQLMRGLLAHYLEGHAWIDPCGAFCIGCSCQDPAVYRHHHLIQSGECEHCLQHLDALTVPTTTICELIYTSIQAHWVLEKGSGLPKDNESILGFTYT
jgi:hypothetical protein